MLFICVEDVCLKYVSIIIISDQLCKKDVGGRDSLVLKVRAVNEG